MSLSYHLKLAAEPKMTYGFLFTNDIKYSLGCCSVVSEFIKKPRYQHALLAHIHHPSAVRFEVVWALREYFGNIDF